jgi:hypothetical protein
MNSGARVWALAHVQDSERFTMTDWVIFVRTCSGVAGTTQQGLQLTRRPFDVQEQHLVSVHTIFKADSIVSIRDAMN